MVPYVTGCFRSLSFVAFCCMAVLVSCKDTDKAPRLRPYENKLGIKPSKLAQIDTVHYTTIQWMETVKQFGTVTEGDSVSFVFKFKNTGVHPLFLCAVKPSCGCTLAKYPQEAFMPGEEGELGVNFNTLEQIGEVHKTIVVTSNTSNGVKHVLAIKGRVLEKPAK